MKKSEMFSVLDTLPEDDITIDDVVDKLSFMEDLQKRVDSIGEEGSTVTHEEARGILKERLGNLWQG